MEPTSPEGLRWLCCLKLPKLQLLWLAALLSVGRMTAQTDSPMHHFSWGSVPSVSQSGLPFPALVQARDVDGSVVTNFNGEVLLTELIPVQGPSLIITEVQTVNTQRVELSNLSGSPVEVSGWRVLLYDRLSWPAPKVTFVVPTGTLCPGFGAFQVRGSASPPDAYPVFNTGVSLAWNGSSANNQVAVLVLDQVGKVVDFFCAVDAYPALIVVPATFTDTHWSGPPAAPNSNAALTFQRGGNSDHNNAADWVAATNSFGVLNSRLQTPFVAAPSQSALVPASVILTNGEWTGLLTATTPGTNVVLRADDWMGHAGDSAPFTVLGLPRLELQVPAEAFKANPGLTGQGSVKIPGAVSSNLLVTLSSSLPNSIVVPPSVMIPVGATNVDFAVSNLDNGLLEGPQVVMLLATASGFAAGSATVTNYDRPASVLTVSLPASVSEASGWLATGQVRSSLPVSGNVAVRLTSSNTNKLFVQDLAIIPAGQTNVSFGYAVVDNPLIDGNQPVTVNATVPGWLPAQTQILVVDNENTNLVLTLSTQANEGATLTNGSIQISGFAPTNVIVALTSDVPAKLLVPTSVLILAGQTSAVYQVTISDDLVAETNQVVRVTATAAGFRAITRNLTVIDNDVFGFSIANLPAAQIAGQPFQVTVTARNRSGNVVPGYSNSVSLAANGPAGSVLVSPALIGPFTNGVWSGLVTLTGENPALVLTVHDGAGHLGSSKSFDVITGLAVKLPISDMVFDPLRAKLWVGVQTGGGTNSQSVVAVDPISGALGTRIPLGSEPRKLALSEDGQFLYVGLMTTGGVVRINLSAGAADLWFQLPQTNHTYAAQMFVPQDDPHALVVQMLGWQGETALYRDGVLQTNQVPPAPYVNDYHFAVYDSPTNFYSIYPGGVRLLNLVSNGLLLVREVLDPSYGGDFVSIGGLLFGTSGGVFDAQDFRRLGAYPASGPVAADAGAGEVFFVSGTRLQAFDLAAFQELGHLDLPIVSGSAAKLLRCGSNLLAVATTRTNLLLLQTALVRQPAIADLSVVQGTSAGTARVGSNFVYSITVSNVGPAIATNAILLDVLPAESFLLSFTSSQGVCTTTNGILRCAFGDLAVGAFATVQLTVQPGVPGLLVNSVWMVGDGINRTNSISRQHNPVVFGPVLPTVTRLGFNSDTLVYDSKRNRLWASTRRFGGAGEYNLRSINLSNGLPELAIPLGYVASAVAMTADQNSLYAAYVNDQDGLNYTPDTFIRRANLVSNIIDMQFLEDDGVADLMGLASFPSGIVVARPFPQDDIALYQNGAAIRRSPTGTGAGILEANPTIPTRFYRLGGGYPGGDLARLDVGASTITFLGSAVLFAFPATPENPVAADIRFGAGLLFSDIGIVANPETMTRVAVLPVVGLVCPDPGAGVVFYLVPNGSQRVLTAFDLTTLAPAWSFTVPGISGSPSDLVLCGPGLLAFRTSADQVFILNTAGMPHLLQSDLAITQTASAVTATTNVPVTFTCTITNAGPSPATSVIVTNQLPPDATILSITSSQGTFTNLSNSVLFSLGDVQAGRTAWATVVATLNHAGFLTNHATVGQGTPDLITSNNFTSTAVRFDIIPVSDLSVSHLTPTAPGGSGSNLVYSVIVSNAGPDTASGVVLTDYLHSSATLVMAAASQGTITSTTDSFTANLGMISNGASATVTVTVWPCCGGIVQSEASTSSSNLDPSTPNNVALGIFSVQGDALAEEIPVPAADIVFDPRQPGILASLAAPLGNISQAIVDFDLQTKAIQPVVSVGNTLGRIAISDDSHYLYVALTDTGGVARVDLPAGAVDLRFPLNIPSAPFGPYQVEDLGVMPGAPETLAVARGGYAGYLSAIALFDSGVQRPVTVDNLGANASYFRFQFAGPTNLYNTSPYGFQAVTVIPTGLTNEGPLFSGFVGEFALDGGLAFMNSGSVLNPNTGDLVGTFPLPGLVVPDLANSRVFFLTERDFGGHYSRRLILRSFDANTQAELWSVKFMPYLDSAVRFIKLGTNGVAFLTASKRMFLVSPSGVGVPTADVSLQQTLLPAPVSVGDRLKCTFLVRNSGPWTASGVVMTSTIPANAEFISASTTVGSCRFTNGTVFCDLGTMTNGATATLTVNLLPLAPGSLTNSASLSLNEYDPNPTNNSAVATTTINPQPGVRIGDVTVLEGAGPGNATISFTLTLSGPSSTNVTVGYQTADGTAIAGQDYNSASGVVSFSPASTSQALSLSIIRSSPSLAPTSFFLLNLLSATNATIARTQAVATIVNRVFRAISVDGGSLAEGNTGFTNMMFKFTLSSTSSVPVSVQYQTANGTALAGADYAPLAGTLVFAPGVTNLMLAVPVFGNTAWAADKTFSVQISQPQNAILALNEAVATILNDDPVPALAILTPPVSQTVTQGASAAFTVTAIGNPLPLNYQWQFNGADISGATNSTLNLISIQWSEAGHYAVKVANASGDSTNRSAGLKVLVRLNGERSANSLILNWTGPFTLQSATNVTGPYLDLPVATSPYTNLIGTESSRFFRLRSAPSDGVLSTSVSANGQFLINCDGLPGYDYVLQVSTNLTDWISIQTNAAPFQFRDPGANNLPMRFYRAVLVP